MQTLIDEGTLFIGLGISHPGAMGNYERARGATPVEPSVIGVSLPLAIFSVVIRYPKYIPINFSSTRPT